jgi:micrococcal nuclease
VPFLVLLLFPTYAHAHRSGCHRWHSCPSDRGTYICGDTGHCSQCPDNRFCEDGRPRRARALEPKVIPSPLPNPSPPATSAIPQVSVTEVIDGDTIVIEGGERVRYIGINTPETKHPTKGVEPFGHEASEANRRLAEGKKVRLEFDVQERDRYGRLLAYVYLLDGTFVNLELVRQGYAQVATYPPNVKHQEEFLEAQGEARAAGRGLWGEPRERAPPEGPIIGNKRSKIYHLPGGAYYNRVSPKNRVYFRTEEKAKAEGYRRSRR